MKQVLASIVLVVLSGAVVATQQPPSVFVELAPSIAPAAEVRPASQKAPIRTRRFVGLRLDLIFGAPADGVSGRQITLNLADGPRVASLSHVDRDATGHRSWVGTVDGVEHSHVVFTERDGVVSGLIDLVGETYQVRTASDGVFALEQIEQSGFAPELQPRRMPDTGEISMLRAEADPLPAADDRGTIDVLILYTPAARTNAGGAPQMQALASQIISDSNTIFNRSGITTRLRLVGVSEFALVEQVDAPGEPGSGMSLDLSALTSSPTARTMRNDVRADLVQLVELSPSAACGIGWLLTNINATDFNGYSIADITCVGQYTPTHEMGHNMGSHHDPANAGGSALFPYSFGYQDPGRFRTVMAYSCSGGAACPRIMNMSNPSVNDPTSARPTGTATQNNATSVNNAANTVANWRQGLPTTAPAAPTNLQSQTTATSASLSWTASAGAASYTLQVGSTSGASNIFNATVGSLTAVSGPVPQGTYFWRVFAVNHLGSSPASTEAQFTVTTVTPPGVPANLQSQVNGNNVTLSWSPVVADSPASAATGYTLQVGTAAGTSNLFNAPVGNVTSISGSVGTGTYFWRLIATNSAGSSAATSDRQFSVGCTVPGAPQNFAFTLSGRNVALTWAAAASGGAVTGYLIEAGSATGLANLVTIPTNSATPGAQATAPPGTFFVRIRGRNACGTGPASNEQTIVVP